MSRQVLPALLLALSGTAQAVLAQEQLPPMAQPQIRGLAPRSGQQVEGNQAVQYQKREDLDQATGAVEREGIENYRQHRLELQHYSFQKRQDLGYIIPPQSADYLEGTEKSFSPEQLSQLFKDVRADDEINKALRQLPLKKSADAKYFLINRIKRIIDLASIESSDGKRRCPEVTHLMCYVLDRGLELADIIDATSDRRQPGIIDQQVRVMAESLAVARDYYLDYFQWKSLPEGQKAKVFNPPYRKFGREYAEKFMRVNESVLSATAQYDVAFTILAYFQYDLMRDVNREGNRAAAQTLFETLNDRPKPDEPDTTTPTRKLNNLRALWAGFFQALDFLDRKSAGGDRGRPNAPEANASGRG